MWKWNKVPCVLDSCTQLVVHHAFAVQVETQIGREGTFHSSLSSTWTRSAFLSGAWVVILRESAESESLSSAQLKDPLLLLFQSLCFLFPGEVQQPTEIFYRKWLYFET